ncbi:MAG: TIGR02281 family clan AA aspartic protease [Filomicrobium sp.]
MSSGTRSLINDVFMVAAIAVAAVWIMANLDTVKHQLGLDQLLPAPQHENSRETASLKPAKGSDPARPKPIGYVELNPDGHGHFNARVEVNGRTIDAMVDTGATVVALSYEDARRSGVFISNSDYTGRVRTANGIAKVAPVTLPRVRIGDILVRNVKGVVSEPGKLNGTLLGMSFLGRLQRVEIRNGRLILQQ